MPKHISQEEQEKWDRRGTDDANEDRSAFLNGPWGKPFESDEATEERQKVYDDARENVYSQRDKK